MIMGVQVVGSRPSAVIRGQCLGGLWGFPPSVPRSVRSFDRENDGYDVMRRIGHRLAATTSVAAFPPLAASSILPRSPNTFNGRRLIPLASCAWMPDPFSAEEF
jgi:hypothetical protein